MAGLSSCIVLAMFNAFVVRFDPAIVHLGPLEIRWYGLMYVIGFVIGTYLYKRLIREGIFRLDIGKVDALVTYMLLGMFLGARIVYVVVYNWPYYYNHLDEVIAVWKGGLSFHGGLIGLAVALFLFAKKHKIPYLHLLDCAVLVSAQGPFFGRLGNFINGELPGRVTDVPWAMIFLDAGPLPRHPSQLYESFFEGLVIFVILWTLRKKVKSMGFIAGLYLILYGTFRFFIEFVREPDVQLGKFFGDIFSMGQILCSLMIIAGILMCLYSRKQKLFR